MKENKTKEIKEQPISSSAKYTGKVTIAFQNKQKKTLSSKTYHNAGCGPLFKFMALCLQGNYKQAEKLRPNRIKLFYNSSLSPSDSTPTDTDSLALTSYVSSNRPAEINTNSDENSYYTTFHFLVPAVYLMSSLSSDEGLSINQIAIYPETTDSCSAYFNLIDSENNEWDPIKLEDLDENINIIIDWQMSIMNK